MVVGAEKSDHEETNPIPIRGTVSWRSMDGVTHRQDVEIARTIRDVPGFDGTIWFKITPNEVEVHPVTDAESWDRALNHKPELP